MGAILAKIAIRKIDTRIHYVEKSNSCYCAANWRLAHPQRTMRFRNKFDPDFTPTEHVMIRPQLFVVPFTEHYKNVSRRDGIPLGYPYPIYSERPISIYALRHVGVIQEEIVSVFDVELSSPPYAEVGIPMGETWVRRFRYLTG